jgi:hypothetical protein
MPIYSHLKNSALSPDEIKVIAGAFEAACEKLGLVHREDPLRDAVAKAIMDCVETGERDPDRLEQFAQTALSR